MTTLMVAAALANDGPTPQLYAEQMGADVELTMRLHENGEPGLYSSLDLARDGEELLVDHTFDAADAVESAWYCSGGDAILWDEDGPIDCDEKPEKCESCGDSDVECPIGGCYQWFLLEHLDRCVPPGEHRWTLQEHGSDWVPADVELVVQPSDEPCGGCGCATGSTTPGVVLGLGMLALGVVARPRRVA